MPVDTPVSPRVRAISNERLDLPDFNRLQDMLDKTIRRQIGGLMGWSSGALSPFTVVYDAGTFHVTIGRFQYFVSEVNTDMQDPGTSHSKAWRGGVYDHLPTAASQYSDVSIAAARALAVGGGAPALGGAYPYLFVRPIAVQTDTEARVQAAGAVETAVSIKTQLDLRHVFEFSTDLMGKLAAGWACVGVVTAWSGVATPGTPTATPGTPTVIPIAAWDSPAVALNSGGIWDSDGDLSTRQLLRVAGGEVAPSNMAYEGSSSAQGFGLVQLLGAVRSQIRRIIDSDAFMPWFQNPSGAGALGMPALAGGLNQLWNKVTPMWARFNTDQVVLPWAAGSFHFNAGPNTYTSIAQGNNAGARRNMTSPATRISAGWVRVPLADALLFGWRYSVAVVTTRPSGPSTNIYLARAEVDLTVPAVIVYLQQVTVAAGPTITGAATDMDFDIVVFITKDV